MLRVVFALQKFDQYIFGRSVTVQSDHKPLVAISTTKCAQEITRDAAENAEI